MKYNARTTNRYALHTLIEKKEKRPDTPLILTVYGKQKTITSKQLEKYK